MRNTLEQLLELSEELLTLAGDGGTYFPEERQLFCNRSQAASQLAQAVALASIVKYDDPS